MNVYTCLHGDREVGLSLRREVDINSLLGEGLVALSWGADLNDVKLSVNEKEKTNLYSLTHTHTHARTHARAHTHTHLSSLLCADSKCEKRRLLGVSW